MKELNKRSRHPKFKKKYRVTNWKTRTTQRRRQHQFSDRAIETIFSLRLIFHLPLIQAEEPIMFFTADRGYDQKSV